MTPAFPPAPWNLRGWGVATVQRVDVRAARQFVPPDCAIVAVAPHTTLGGVLFASYESGSTLVYRELAIVAALVRVGRRVAFYLPRLYVDSLAALAGGRAIWGLPKEPAAFDVGPAGDAAARSAQRVIVTHESAGDIIRMRMRVAPGRTGFRLPLFVPAVGMRADRWLFLRGRLSARLGLAHAQIELAPESEFAALSLDRPLFALSFDALELRVPKPATIPRARS